MLMLAAFFGIFVYGLLSALPGSVLPTLERGRFLPDDSAVGTFLLINAAGAVLAYLVSGPVIDRVGKKFALACGAALVVASMVGFALTVTNASPPAALLAIFCCSLVLGLGANALVAAGHALVADVASLWRNAALNLLDICFGLGLAALPLVTLENRMHEVRLGVRLQEPRARPRREHRCHPGPRGRFVSIEKLGFQAVCWTFCRQSYI